jgi:competence ComEA-like helix-hairpin-helix protein
MWGWILSGWSLLVVATSCLILFRGALIRLHPPPVVNALSAEESKTVSTSSGPSGKLHSAEGGIDLNRASIEELAAVPGIGPVLARRIATRRSENGPFRSLEDLGAIPGVGPKKISILSRHLATGGS